MDDGKGEIPVCILITGGTADYSDDDIIDVNKEFKEECKAGVLIGVHYGNKGGNFNTVKQIVEDANEGTSGKKEIIKGKGSIDLLQKASNGADLEGKFTALGEALRELCQDSNAAKIEACTQMMAEMGKEAGKTAARKREEAKQESEALVARMD